jgi:hypothetical protein
MMKFLRVPLCFGILTALCALTFNQVFAQSEATKPGSKKSEAQLSFDKLKTLAGTWKGALTTEPPQSGMPDQGWISLRVTSRGNALVHEMKQPGTPDDASKDDPITMLYLDGERLVLTHYCDAGNRPRMTGKMAADGKTVEFEFLDVAGGTQYGHMHHAVFTIIDENHHTEEWTYMAGDQPIHARFDLQRVK